MKPETDNPCADCPENCCRSLRKLKLSPTEYERVYAVFRENFDIERKGLLYELTMHKGVNCPHLGDQDLCTVYKTRPVECRLFPYTVNQTYCIGPLIWFTYHGRTPCPRKNNGLFPSHREARKWIHRLATETYGARKIYFVFYEGTGYRLLSKLSRMLRLKKIARRLR